MTRVEGENTRLRHYLARLHRKTLCYSLVSGDGEVFNSIATSLLKVWENTRINLVHLSVQQRPPKLVKLMRRLYTILR